MRSEITGGKVDVVDGRLGQASVERISSGTERLRALVADLISKLGSFILLKEEKCEPVERKKDNLPSYFAHLEGLASENDQALNELERIVSSIKL